MRKEPVSRMKPNQRDIEAVCDYVQSLCGIYLDDSKDYLIESRLSSLVKQYECQDYKQLTDKARTTPELKTDVIDAITTNETLWFRDAAPFEALRHKIIPELIDAKSGSMFPKKFRIWSAACSTGQEAYSIAMAFADVVPDFENWDLEILGTDISPSAVEKAKRGIYTNLEISRGLEQRYQGSYFLQNGGDWQINEVLRKVCKFEQRNLLEPWSHKNEFDIIFCRNVAIYFTPEDRKQLFLRMKDALVPGGWFFTGSGESLMDLGENWRPFQHCRATCYQPNGCNGIATLQR